MSGRVSRETRQARALIALLEALPDEQLDRVLEGVDAARKHPAPSGERRRHRPCGICGWYFPRCRELFADDHEFEPPRRRPADLDAAAETCCETPTPDVSGACGSCGVQIA